MTNKCLGGFTVSLGVIALAGLIGCAQDEYVKGFQYMPPTSTAQLRHDDPSANTGPAATVTASVAGVRRADRKTGPSAIEVKLRIDNTGPGVVSLDPASIELLAGEFDTFPAAKMQPAGVATVPPTKSQTIIADFPFPPGKTYETMKLSNLRLKYVASLDGHAFPQSVPFYYLP